MSTNKDQENLGDLDRLDGELKELAKLQEGQEDPEEKLLKDFRSLVEQVFAGPDPSVLEEILGETESDLESELDGDIAGDLDSALENDSAGELVKDPETDTAAYLLHGKTGNFGQQAKQNNSRALDTGNVDDLDSLDSLTELDGLDDLDGLGGAVDPSGLANLANLANLDNRAKPTNPNRLANLGNPTNRTNPTNPNSLNSSSQRASWGNPVGSAGSRGSEELRVQNARAEAELVELTRALEARATEHDFDPSPVRMQKALSILGDPQTTYSVIHVAGTNGKTSTSRVAESLLREFGLRVGHYTSPHLQSITERINLDGRQLSAAEFLAAWQDVAPYVAMVDAAEQEQGKPQISYFEALTVMAFAAFADYPVDVAVLECGMGGRWDATNVVDAGVAVITSISMDHEEWLGHSLVEIAAEKVEIIKPKSIAVIMRQDEAVLDLLLEKCRAQDALARVEGVDWEVLARSVGVGGQMITVRTPAAVYEDIFVPLNGEFQAHNAAAALVAVESLLGGRALPADIVERGIGAASSPGRLEVVRTSPTVIVDGAHNPAGVTALVETLPETFQLGYTVGIFACMGDKRVEEMLSLAEPVFDDLVVTTLPGSRAMPVDDLCEVATDVFGSDRVYTADTLEEAIDKATMLADSVSDPMLSRGIVAFGSLYLVGGIKILLGR